MQKFSGWEYLLIDVANQFGKDKLVFEERIQWATDHLDVLETLADQAETQPLYWKAVMAIRKAQAGIPTGHLVGFDGVCSGVQIMSALTGCEAGARATGLVDPNVRADAYTATTVTMNEILGGGLTVSRKDAKQALMTSFYGSKKTPKDIFGEDTPELNAFYQAMQIVAPGAWELLQDLLASWQPYALVHSWKLPDGFDARVKVMEKIENTPRNRIEVDELDHATFTYIWYENKGSKRGLSNVANVVHSVDAYVLRCIHRRCNYDVKMVEAAHAALQEESTLRGRGFTSQVQPDGNQHPKMAYYMDLYSRAKMADVVILPYVKDGHDTQYMSTEHINELLVITTGMLQYKPFEVVTIHDEFKCGPNNMNHLRQQYINILAGLADSVLVSDILGQLHGMKGSFTKLSTDLSTKIRNSNYALC